MSQDNSRKRTHSNTFLDIITQEYITVQHEDVVLVKKNFRHSYVINTSYFNYKVKEDLKKGNINITNNLKNNNLTYHEDDFSILVELDIMCTNGKVYTMHVDILGIRGKKKPPLYTEDPEINNMVSYYINLHKGTHYGCSTKTCFEIFEKFNCFEEFPVYCKKCNVTQCITCQCDWNDHFGISCEMYQFKLKINKIKIEEHEYKSLKEGSAQPCPSCQFLIYRIDGCNKIKCSCGTLFCWICGENLSNYSNPYEHFSDRLTNDANVKKCKAETFSSLKDSMKIIADLNEIRFKEAYKIFEEQKIKKPDHQEITEMKKQVKNNTKILNEYLSEIETLLPFVESKIDFDVQQQVQKHIESLQFRIKEISNDIEGINYKINQAEMKQKQKNEDDDIKIINKTNQEINDEIIDWDENPIDWDENMQLNEIPFIIFEEPKPEDVLRSDTIKNITSKEIIASGKLNRQ